MTRHDYKFRPPARREDGRFVPAIPNFVEKHPKDWDLIDNLASLRAMSRNAISASTRVTTVQPVTRVESFGQVLIVPHDPALIKYIFVENGENYKLNSIRQAVLEPILKQGLLTADGAEWKRARHALAPIFTPRHTKNFAPAMRDCTDRLLPKLISEGDIMMAPKMLSLTYQVLSETLFSGEVEDEGEDMLRDVGHFLTTLGKVDPLDIIGAPKIFPRVTRLRGYGAIRRMRRRVAELAADRLARIEAASPVPDDFLTLLIKTGADEGEPLSNSEIEDHIVTFIGAGHETTSRALTWMFYLLSQDEAVRERLEAEVDALDITLPPEHWAAHMPWSIACFEESMRIYPPAPIISREAVEDDKFGDMDISAGDNVLVNLWALHRHERLWEAPLQFRPERFFGQARNKIDRFQYLPFGMGHRVCIGQRFAMQEAAIMIALMARRYRFDYAGDEDPWPVMRITLQTENDMPMRVTKR